MKSSLPHRSRIPGFTLIELLVSITILSIILFSLAQAIGFVSQLWVSGIGVVDNFTKARDIMTIMDRDVQQMVMRPDIGAFVDSSGNPACAFFTNEQSSSDTRAVTLVQYLPPTGSTNPLAQSGAIVRLTYPMKFSTGITPLVQGNVSSTPPTVIAQTGTFTSANVSSGVVQAEPLATGVIQFQYQFVDGTGKILNPPYVPTGTSLTATPFYYDYVATTSGYNPRAVVVSLLVLSNGAYQLASSNATVMSNLQTDFAGAPGADTVYSQFWNTTLNSSSGVSNLPLPVRSGLRVFQRYIPLPLITPSS